MIVYLWVKVNTIWSERSYFLVSCCIFSLNCQSSPAFSIVPGNADGERWLTFQASRILCFDVCSVISVGDSCFAGSWKAYQLWNLQVLTVFRNNLSCLSLCLAKYLWKKYWDGHLLSLDQKISTYNFFNSSWILVFVLFEDMFPVLLAVHMRDLLLPRLWQW